NCQCEGHYSQGQSNLCRQRRERERLWQAVRILADPGPLLEALAEAGVLAEVEREAKAETERLRHLLGSHADGHLCTCEMIDPGVYHGENMHPPEWEQDPWCPTHPDVGYIKTEVAARERQAKAAAWDEGWVSRHCAPTEGGYVRNGTRASPCREAKP